MLVLASQVWTGSLGLTAAVIIAGLMDWLMVDDAESDEEQCEKACKPDIIDPRL